MGSLGRLGRFILLSVVVGLSPVRLAAQTVSVPGGLQELSWTKDEFTAQSFVNDTRLAIASFWIGIENDGVADTDELETIEVVFSGVPWVVDDNENGVNGDAGEGDALDGSPSTGLPLGWHRVQIPETPQTNSGRIPPGGTFTILLKDENGASLSGRLIDLIPAWALSGGDSTTRIEAPFTITDALPSANVVIQGLNAPPGSTTFVAMLRNGDPLKRLSKVQINPQGGIVLSTASAPGATFTLVDRTLYWPSALTPSASSRLTVTLTSVSRTLTTTVTFQATEYLTGGGGVQPVPALPWWSLGLLVGGALLGALVLLRRRG